jgi:AraC-like DNA-binding protein
MLQTRHELLALFKNPVFTPHPVHTGGTRTFAGLDTWNDKPVIQLPRLRVEILGIDYLENSTGATVAAPLHFQQDCFRLWYQVDGSGILQDVSRKSFGAARPGLLGVMERCRRFTYLHQKGTFESFQLLFSLLPAPGAKCYWNSGVEGKVVLDEKNRLWCENIVFDLLLAVTAGQEPNGLAATARILDILSLLFAKNILTVEETQFPKNRAHGLVTKAKTFMEIHYAGLRHQNALEHECGVDINYLNTVFKKETGATLYDYLTRLRMDQAKHFLETTDDPVNAIAQRVGYPNNNSFSRAFKRAEKCTPLDFRKRSRDGKI